MKKLTFCVVLAAAAIVSGCSRAASEGIGIVTGAKGSFLPIRPQGADSHTPALGDYARFELGRIEDGIGGQTPAGLFAELPEAFRKELERAKLPNREGGKTLLIRGRVIHYEDSNLLGFALGPLEEVIVLTQFVDKASDTVLGEANCIGRTKEAINAGAGKKAEGLAKAFVKWIESRFPADRKTE